MTHPARGRSLAYLSLLLLALGVAPACGDDDDDDGGEGEGEGEGEAAVEAVFDPASRDMGSGPWPSDLYRDEAGRVRPTSLVYSGEYADSLLDCLDGFGLVTPLTVFVTGPVDLATAPDAGWLVDPRDGRRIPLTAQFQERTGALSFRAPTGVVLDESTTYAFGLTADVLDAGGDPVVADPDFAALRDADTAPADAALARAWSIVSPGVQALVSAGAERDRIVVATTFTTMDATSTVAAMATAVRAEDARAASVLRVVPDAEGDLDDLLGVPAAPLLGRDNPGVPDGSAATHDHVRFVIHGTFPSPYFLAEEPGDHGWVDLDDDGVPIVKSTDTVPFTLILPTEVPLADLPLVIVQHGLGGNRGDALGIAEGMCARGLAVVAIDAAFHGLRAGGGRDEENNFTGAAVPDLLGDTSGSSIVLSYVGALLSGYARPGMHPYYFRDSNRQSASDLFALVDLVRRGDWGAVQAAHPDLAELSFADGPIGFYGVSLGTIFGTVFLANEPAIGGAVLGVPGGDLLTLVQNSPPFNEGYFPIFFPLLGIDGEEFDYVTSSPAYDPVFGVWAAILEGGDAIAFAPRLADSSMAILTEMAIDDETLSNVATEGLLAALHVPLDTQRYEARYAELEPATAYPIASAQGRSARAAVAWSPASHGMMFSREAESNFVPPVLPPFERRDPPETFTNPIDAVVAHAAAFLTSVTEGAPVIEAPPDASE